MDRQLGREGAENAAHQKVCVGPALVDLHAGVTADESLDDHAAEDAVDRLIRHRHVAGGPHAAGAGHGENTLHLGIDIEHHPALEHRRLQRHGPQHPDFLSGGQHHLQPGMGQVLRLQGRQGHGHGDSVVAAQGGSLGPDVGPVGPQTQALSGHIQVTARLPVTDHVQVALDNYSGDILIARRRRFDQHHVPSLVLIDLQAVASAEGRAVVAQGLGVAGAVGNGANFRKIVHHPLGVHRIKHRHRSASS